VAAGVVSTQVATLTERVLQAMFMTKLKIAAAVVLAVGLLGMGGGAFTYSALAKEKEQPKKVADSPEKPGLKRELAVNAPAPKDQEKEKPGPKKLTNERMEEFRDALHRVVKFEGLNDPKASLGEFLEQLADRYELTFDVNEDAFKADCVADAWAAPIAEKPIPRLVKISLHSLLQKVLSRVPAESGTTFIIRGDYIQITTQSALRKEFGLDKDKPLLPLVIASFEKSALEDALKQLSAEAGFNVALDSQNLDKTKSTVTAEFASVPIDTAVGILADMAGMRAVLLENVLYVTTKENADRLKLEREKRISEKPQTETKHEHEKAVETKKAGERKPEPKK
jgi:hypothetical protein